VYKSVVVKQRNNTTVIGSAEGGIYG